MYTLASIIGIDDERVGVRAAACLHAWQLHRTVDVADVEDPHAAEPFGVHRTGRAL